MTRRRHDRPWPAAIVLLLLLLACFARLVAQPSALIVDPDRPSLDHARRADDPPTVGNDATRLFIPHHAAIAGHLARLGRVPTWDDRGFGGRPLVGNPQAGLFYPPTRLAWRSWFPGILGWLTVLHLLWGGCGTYLLARAMALDRWGSTVAAGCFQASPYVLAQAFEGHAPHVWSASWMPWAFLAASRLRLGEVRAGLMLVPILACAGLAGHLQETYLLAVALFAWWIGDLILKVRDHSSMVPAWRSALFLSVLTLLILGVTAVEWLPDLHASRWAIRDAGLPIDQAGRYHLFPINALQLLSPFALGKPWNYFGHDNYWESLTSIGLIPLSLAIAGILLAPDRRAVRGWSILVAVSIWVAAGRQLGLFSLLYHLLPGFDRFRVPARSLFLASLGVSLLAGFGVDALRRLADRPDEWSAWARSTTRSSLLLAVVVMLGAVAQGFLTPIDPTARRVPELARVLPALASIAHQPMFWVAVVGLGIIPQLGRGDASSRRAAIGGLGLLGLVELAGYGADLIVVAPLARFLGPDPISRAIERDWGPRAGSPLIRAVDSFYDDLRAGAHGFRKANINDSFQLRHAAPSYEPLYRIFATAPSQPDRPLDLAVSEHRRRIRQGSLDRMGVNYLVADRSLPDVDWPLVDSGTWEGRAYAVYRNETASPRAEFKPMTETRTSLETFHQNVPTTHLTWNSDAPDRWSLQLETKTPGQIRLTETWMPDWEFRTADGVKIPCVERDGQLTIMLRSPGIHRILGNYQPRFHEAGGTLTSLSIIAWITSVICLPKWIGSKSDAG